MESSLASDLMIFLSPPPPPDSWPAPGGPPPRPDPAPSSSRHDSSPSHDGQTPRIPELPVPWYAPHAARHGATATAAAASVQPQYEPRHGDGDAASFAAAFHGHVPPTSRPSALPHGHRKHLPPRAHADGRGLPRGRTRREIHPLPGPVWCDHARTDASKYGQHHGRPETGNTQSHDARCRCDARHFPDGAAWHAGGTAGHAPAVHLADCRELPGQQCPAHQARAQSIVQHARRHQGTPCSSLLQQPCCQLWSTGKFINPLSPTVPYNGC